VGSAIVKHTSPTGGRRGNAETQKAHGSFRENGSSHPNCCLNNHGLNNVRQDVSRNDAQIARAKRPRRLHKFELADRQNLRAH